MKRILFLSFLLAMILTGCNRYKEVILHGYQPRSLEGMVFEKGSVSARAILDIDIENPAAVRYSIESLEASVFNGKGDLFATVTLEKPACVEKLTRDTVSVPVTLHLSNPLANIASGIFSGEMSDASSFSVNIEMDVKAGSIRRHICKEAVPLDKLADILNNNRNQEDEN
ncbi:MAG: hypothetical protein KBT00_02460 [Bacteroidales bacterium]|nr:hypothetical protein [Candidatus Cacconaster merdequi]